MELENVEITESDKLRYLPHVENWSYLDLFLQNNKLDELELLKMIKIEIHHKCRPYIINRLHSRYNRIRSNREAKDLDKYRVNIATSKKKALISRETNRSVSDNTD
jgi:hypothetical protein